MTEKEMWAMQLDWPSGTHAAEIWIAGFEHAKKLMIIRLTTAPLEKVAKELLYLGDQEVPERSDV